jgi:hypothetical protein
VTAPLKRVQFKIWTLLKVRAQFPLILITFNFAPAAWITFFLVFEAVTFPATPAMRLLQRGCVSLPLVKLV